MQPTALSPTTDNGWMDGPSGRHGLVTQAAGWHRVAEGSTESAYRM